MAQTLKLSHSPKALASLAEQFKALGDETRLGLMTVSYTHLRAHETGRNLV